MSISLIFLYVLVSILVVLFTVFKTLLFLTEVCGSSMSPSLMDGEFKIGVRVFRKNKCQIGSVYVLKVPYESEEERYIVKRLNHIKDNQYYFLGDNPDYSFDSRHYGYVSPKNVVAKIIMKEGNFHDRV